MLLRLNFKETVCSRRAFDTFSYEPIILIGLVKLNGYERNECRTIHMVQRTAETITVRHHHNMHLLQFSIYCLLLGVMERTDIKYSFRFNTFEESTSRKVMIVSLYVK